MTAVPTGSVELRVLSWAEADEATRRRVLTRGGVLGDPTSPAPLTESIRTLLEDVRTRGDAALVDALSRFDMVSCGPDELRVPDAAFAAARASLDPSVHAAIVLAIERSTAFNRQIVDRASWSAQTQTSTVGEIARPIESAGLFVPSGKGSFPSVLVQIGTPAVVAGVPRVVVVVPPDPLRSGGVDPATLVVAQELGLRDVFRLNGPSGIGAMALGTESVPRVSTIVGPGSPAVTVAQQLCQGYGCQVVSGLGPTDSLIIADASADPVVLAADVINEAEHGMDSSAVLVSTDAALLETVSRHVRDQLDRLPEPRRAYATSSLATGGLLLARDRAEAMEIANQYAPEHLQLAVEDPRAWLSAVRFAGTVLLGQWTSFAASNYVIGTPATLPTTGFATSVSGVTAHTYLNLISTAELGAEGFWELASAIEDLAAHEGFPAHAQSVTVRREVHGRHRQG